MFIRVELVSVRCIDPEDGADELLLMSEVRTETPEGTKVAAQGRAFLIVDFEEDEVLTQGFNPEEADFEVDHDFRDPILFDSRRNDPDGTLDVESIRRIRMRHVGLEIDGIGATGTLAESAFERWISDEREVYQGGGDRHDVLWDLSWNVSRARILRAFRNAELPDPVTLSGVSDESRRSYAIGGSTEVPQLLETTRVAVPDSHEYEFTLSYRWRFE